MTWLRLKCWFNGNYYLKMTKVDGEAQYTFQMCHPAYYVLKDKADELVRGGWKLVTLTEPTPNGVC